MKKLILILFLTVLSLPVFAQVNKTVTMIYDNAVTSTNDTLTSSWISIEDYNQVEIYVEVGDSISFNGTFNIEYRAGVETAVSLAPYSSDTASISNLATATAEASGKVLRGFTVNNIPGSNFIRVVAIRRTYSTAATSSLKVIAVLRK